MYPLTSFLTKTDVGWHALTMVNKKSNVVKFSKTHSLLPSCYLILPSMSWTLIRYESLHISWSSSLRYSSHRTQSLIVTATGPPTPKPHCPFLTLTHNILYQQLAYKANASIYMCFIALCSSKKWHRSWNTCHHNSPTSSIDCSLGKKANCLCDLARKY